MALPMMILSLFLKRAGSSRAKPIQLARIKLSRLSCRKVSRAMGGAADSLSVRALFAKLARFARDPGDEVTLG